MKKALAKLLTTAVMGLALVSCTAVVTTPGGGYYDCWYEWEYDWFYDDYVEVEYCEYVYYNSNGSQVTEEIDVVGNVADLEAYALEKTASIYAEKFSLSAEQSMKIAKNIKDFQALEDRSESDIADFAQKLYGVNPSEVIEAVSSAQVGDNAKLDSVIESAAQSFGTSNDTMKEIVKDLHGHALKSNGIDL